MQRGGVAITDIDMTATQAKALVVGLGQTGMSCARYLAQQGYRVTVTDTRVAPPMLDRLRAELPQVEVHPGGLLPELFVDPGLLVVSPGVPLREPVIAEARARGVEVLGDVDLFVHVAQSPVVAITGSNGKSTVTALVGAMCREAGLDTAVGGNIGVPVLELLREPEADVYVLELSSFQLELVQHLPCAAAVVLNVSEDHMDRYDSVDQYAAAKAHIYDAARHCVVNADDPRVMAMAPAGCAVTTFTLSAPHDDTSYGLVEHLGGIWLAHGARLLLPAEEVPLAGRHNLANVLAAMAVAESVAVPQDAMLRAVQGFQGLPHRSALVVERNGVRWLDDSKGTNVGATVAALSGMDRPVVLIAGGDGKGADFSGLRDAVAKHARAVVLIGRDGPLIEAALANVVPTERAADMDDAVARAAALALPGDTVLLSPACASFDMFRDYVQRGEVFAAAVGRLLR